MGRKRITRTFNGESRKVNGKTKICRRKNKQGTFEKREVKMHLPDGTTTTATRYIARYFLTIDGQQVRKSKTLTATTLDEARAELAQILGNSEIFTQERELEKNQLKLQGVKEEVKHIQEEREKEAAARLAEEAERRAVAISAAWPLYVASKKRPDSGQRTLAGYEAQYRIFAEWMARNHPEQPKLRDVNPATAEQFIGHIQQTRSRNTRNKYLVFLRTFWRVLRWNADAQLSIDPWDGLRNLILNPDTQHHRDLTLDEIRRVAEVLSSDRLKRELSYIDKPHDKRIKPQTIDLRRELLGAFAIAIYTGWRLGDTVTASWDNIDLDLGTMATTPRKTKRRYGWTVKVSIHPALRALLTSVPKENRTGYILPALAKIYLEKEPSVITNRIQAAFRAAGIVTTADASNEGGGKKKRTTIGFHSTRHFFKSWLANHGVNNDVVDYLMTHEQGKVKASYYHDNRATIARAIATIPFIPELTGDAQRCRNAPADALDVKYEIMPVTDAEASEGRFRAFCDTLDGMTAQELERAALEIARRRREMV